MCVMRVGVSPNPNPNPILKGDRHAISQLDHFLCLNQLLGFCSSSDDEIPVPVKLLQKRKVSLKAMVNHNPPQGLLAPFTSVSCITTSCR